MVSKVLAIDVKLQADGFIAETLDRFEVPFFGRLASSILDDE